VRQKQDRETDIYILRVYEHLSLCLNCIREWLIFVSSFHFVQNIDIHSISVLSFILQTFVKNFRSPLQLILDNSDYSWTFNSDETKTWAAIEQFLIIILFCWTYYRYFIAVFERNVLFNTRVCIAQLLLYFLYVRVLYFSVCL